MRVGISPPSYGGFPDGPFEFLARVAEIADAGGIDTIWVCDHLALPEEDVRANGGRTGVDEPLEAWTVLAMLAARTSRIRVGTEVTPLPLRHPVLLAKTVSTLDLLSGGRVVLGLGGGWFADEFRAAGIEFRPYRERMEQTREQAALVRRLLDRDIVPRREDGRVPIWFGGRSERILRLVAELGDGWITATNASPAEVEQGWERLRALLAEAGRDPAEVAVAVPLVARVAETTARARDDIERYIERGAFEGFVKEFLADATRAYGIWGSPEECLRKLEPYAALGVAHVILDLRPPDFTLDSVERICFDLIPLLCERAWTPARS